jgi:hypothetical protein
MISNGQKTSLLIPSQLPAFIRENPDYDNFVSFVQAYYEWLETEGNVSDRAQNLLNYKDIDRTTNDFIDYFINDFLQYFPQDALISKATAVKFARQLYKSKGTPASYQFLFRVLYNSDFDVYYKKDSVLKASDGNWYISKSLKLATIDVNFLNINNYRIFGETTKSIAVVENSVLAGNKTEVFISNIEKLFQSGEFIRVVNNRNQDVYFLDGVEVPAGTIGSEVLRAKIVGQISSIKIDPNNRGSYYNAGDPVIVYGGLNAANGHGALAVVGSVTTGSIQNLNVLQGGFGYRENPNSAIIFTNDPSDTTGHGGVAIVPTVNPDIHYEADVTFVPTNSIEFQKNYTIGSGNYHFDSISNANVNTKLSDAFTFANYPTYPISSVLLTSGGGGYTKIPTVTAVSEYLDNTESTYADLSKIGILGPIQITSGGTGYLINDKIVFTDGHGYGANANVVNVDTNGSITEIRYQPTGKYPLGGMGYTNDSPPVVTVNSSNVSAYGASLYVPGILGTGATFSVTTTSVGTVTTISILDNGEDYISVPNVSLKVEDIVVSNLLINNFPQLGQIIYQGTDIASATYVAKVNNATLLLPDGNNPELSLYNLRVFDYTNVPNPNQNLKISNTSISMVMANTAYKPPGTPVDIKSVYNSNGVRIYGDGKAKANASFLNGLVLGAGQYIDKRGQPSSYNVLQSSVYNNFTYEITVEKEIAKYRNILLNLLHPSGLKMIGRYVLNSSNNFYTQYNTADFQKSYSLSYYTNDVESYITMNLTSANSYNNVITFHTLNGATILNTLYPNTSISFLANDGTLFTSEVASSNSQSNTATLKDSVWLTTSGLTAVSSNVTIFGNSIFG